MILSIQWYPGHMAKATRKIKEHLKLVDVIIELIDARTPLSSQNPMLQTIITNHPKVMVMMKRDLADETETQKWLTYFKQRREGVMAIDVFQHSHIRETIQTAKQIGKKRFEKEVKNRPVRALILGIPNVGKSTFINQLVNKKVTRVGNRPGITKDQQWINVDKDFELLDTPGILWPKFEDEQVGLKLAAIGTIKDQLLPLQDVAAFVISYLQRHYPGLLDKRYEITADDLDMWSIFESIGKKRGALQSGGKVNFDQVANIILHDFRLGRIGKITLETMD